MDGGHGQEAGRPAPCRSRTVREMLTSYGSSVQVALVIGTMTGSVYALLEPEDNPLNLLPRLVLPRLSMPLGICHSDEAPTGSYTLDLSGSASAGITGDPVSLALPRALASRTILHPLSMQLTTYSTLGLSQESRADVTSFLTPVGW